MCWSSAKPTQEDEVSTTKTNETVTQTTKNKECPGGSMPCNSTDGHCSWFGQCCYNTDMVKFCRCEKGRRGDFCQSRSYGSSHSHSESQGTQAVAAFSALIGVIVILLFLALVALQIKYYRERKKRRHEQNKISRPDASDKGSKKVLITQPGYSWRESVRRTGSKAAHKFRNTLSNSVPDDLFGVGLKLAIFGGFKPSDHQSTADKGEANAPTTLRCFSADPALGDRQTICDKEDNANTSNDPIPVQMPASASAAASTGEAATEDTVM